MKKTATLLAALTAASIFPSALHAQTEDLPITEEAPVTAPAPSDPAADAKATVEAYNAGVAALNKNNLVEAARQFEKATVLTPTDAGAQMFLGYVRLRQEKYPEALISLEAARSLGNRLDTKLQPVLYNNLGIAYANSDRADDALKAYQKALDLSGADEYADARFNLAFALLAQKKTKQALPHLLKLREQRTTDKTFQSSIYDGLAEVYEADENWAQALGAYRKVIEFNPTDPTARFNFALALSKTGRVDDAVIQAREVLKLRANHGPSLLLLGDLYSRKMDWKNSKDVLTRYVKINPNEFSAWFSLAVANDYTADFTSALAAYAKAEALAPEDPAVKNNIGRIYFKQGERDAAKYDLAVTKLKEALALEENFDDARVNLALVLASQEKWSEANEQWTVYLNAIRVDLQKPSTPAAEKIALKARALSARGALAENYLKSGSYANAAKEYKAILVEMPTNLDAMSNLGLALYHTKNYEEATKNYREVIRRDPKNAIAHNNLGVVLEARGQRAEAITFYQKAIQLKPDYTEAKANRDRLTTAT